MLLLENIQSMRGGNETMLILNENEMWQAVTLPEVIEAVEDAFAIHKSGRFHMPDRMVAQRDWRS